MEVFGVGRSVHGGSRGVVMPGPARLGPEKHGGRLLGGTVRIGETLARSRGELMEVGRHLSGLLEPAGASLVNDAIRFVENQVCRIAVIGQIKAGKSSFINAFVQMPELLPTDVNPWTTAVTHLHLRAQHPHEHAATFRFFNAEEWHQLAEGGGRLRELTEKLVPGFESELLRQHVTGLKEKAAARLGPEFGQLLGLVHAFPRLTEDLLRQYVCAGDQTGISFPGDATGRYADITKSADLYLPRGPFDYPVTVIDTPGTNDPFLVRDEITRRALQQADLYIVVLTARQALSAADIALLRILRGLHKERIIVFLNRIDELREIAADSEEVVGAVRARLNAEFPGAEIPLVAGSAWWGNCALAREAPEFDTCLSGRAIKYFQIKNYLRREDLVRPVGQGEAPNLRAALYEASGLQQINRALDQMLAGGQSAYVLRQLAASFTELARTSESTIRQELQSLSDTNTTVLAASEHWDRELARLRKELQALQEIGGVIDAASAQFREDMMAIVTEEMRLLRARLLGAIGASAAHERDGLICTLQAGASPTSWSFEALHLRRMLGQEFAQVFGRAEARLNALRRSVLPQLQGLLGVLTRNQESSLLPEIGHRPHPPPSLSSLGRAVALDLDTSWWSFFWRARPRPEQRGAEIERLIEEAFHPVAEELVEAATANLIEHVEIATKWSFGICNTIAQSIVERRRQLMAHFESLKGNIQGTVDPGMTSQQQRYIGALVERLERTVELRKRLVVLGGEISRGLAGPER